MTALIQDLTRLFGSQAVSDDAADRSAYAHDLWPRQLIATRGGFSRPAGPCAIVWPTHRDQIAEILAFANRHGVRVAPFGGGSAVTGALALSDDVIAVDVKRMRTLHSVDLARGVFTADAGVLGEHLEDQLARRGATLGHFPSSIYCSTLGGWIATRSAGQCSGRYGKIEDMVVALEGVLPTGETFSCGPPRHGVVDARALLVGSEGLFGFITRATLRAWPAPTERRFGAFTFRTLNAAWSAVRKIYQAGLRPAVARLYDPLDTYLFKSGGKTHGERRHSAGERHAVAEFLLRRVLHYPGVLNRLNVRFGETLFGRSLLLLIFEGTENESIEEAAARGFALARDGGGLDADEALARRWLSRRHSMGYRQPPTFARGIWVDTMEVAAPWSSLYELYEGVRFALSEGGFVMAHLSHAYPDGCSIYFTFVGGSPSDSDALARYDATWARALEAAHRAGGTISHHHGIGRAKRSAMQLELGAGVKVISALARAVDPGSIMARGSLIPAEDQGLTPGCTELPTVNAVVIDQESRLATLPTGMPLSKVRSSLAAHGLVLPNECEALTVHEWLARSNAIAVEADPVDHRIAGYSARLPSGEVARTIPAPRRAAGPDLLHLFACGNGRYGQLCSVTVRVHSHDEAGPRWTPTVDAPAVDQDPAIQNWLERVEL